MPATGNSYFAHLTLREDENFDDFSKLRGVFIFITSANLSQSLILFTVLNMRSIRLYNGHIDYALSPQF